MRTIYISDLDGTLIKRSITIDFLNWLYDKKIVQGCHEVSKWKDNYLDDELHERLVKAFYEEIKGVPYKYLVSLSKLFIADYSRWCDFLPSMNMIDKENTIIISGSPDFLIKAFCMQFKIKEGYGCLLFVDNDKVNGVRVKTHTATAKSTIIESLFDVGKIHQDDYIIGFGDSKYDKGIFDYTNDAYLVRPTEETKEWYKTNCSYFEDISIIN